MASPNTARKEVIDSKVSQEVRLVVEFTMKNVANKEDFESMGGVEPLVKYLLDSETLHGLVEENFKVLHIGIISDTDSGEACPGCFAPITLENVGGYRTYCMNCMKAFPDFPDDGKGYSIAGMYPNFKWV